jgi:predicted GIY-YIG superfamily endonuclease
MSIFMQRLPFDPANVAGVPRAPGVYIIRLRGGIPFYVGRSRQDIHERLWRHVMGTGSRKVMEALSRHTPLEFEYQEMISVEQAEAILIRELGTSRLGNLRRETDPADW